MITDKDLSKSLKELNQDIIWREDRQDAIRYKLIHNLRQEKRPQKSQTRRKFIPLLSIVLTITLLTIIVMSEFSSPDQTTLSSGNQDTHLIAGEKNTQNDLLTQSNIMRVIKEQLTSDLALVLPKEIDLPEGKYLTALTFSDKSSYEVIFYQHDKPIGVNSEQLSSPDNPAEVLARIHVKKYDTVEQANHEISYEKFTKQSGKPIKLRRTLMGYQVTQADSVETHWNIGRWALTTHASVENTDRSVSLAKEVTVFLEDNLLPIPQKNGYVYLDADHKSNQITWQKDTIVYTIDRVTDPFQALEMAVDFD